MAVTILDFLVPPTYDVNLLAVTDASVYVGGVPTLGTLYITPPGFDEVNVAFTPEETNIYGSNNLEITEPDCREPLPDGIYRIKYQISSPVIAEVTKSVLRVDKLQEKFDNAFLQLDLMECDGALTTQNSVTLNTINFFIQGAIAAANNCAEKEALKLYDQANKMLDHFMKCGCGCSGNNYVINFK